MKVTFLTPVRHDGKDYNEDDTCEVADEVAAALIDAGSAAPSGKKSTKPATKATPKVIEGEDSANTNGASYDNSGADQNSDNQDPQ